MPPLEIYKSVGATDRRDLNLWETTLVLLGAVTLDWVYGDPPNRFHPVAWMGSLIDFLKAGGLNRGKGYQLVYGLLMVAAVSSLIFMVSAWFLYYLLVLNPILYVVAGLLLLKSSFSFSGLSRVSTEIASNLKRGNLNEARRLVAEHLVSRDTDGLDGPAVASAAIESVTENLTDSLVAPLFYFLFGGVPGALAYRFINTADAMLGYRDPAHEYLGKGAARIDDAAGFIPARLAGLLLVAAAWLQRENARGAWDSMKAQHSLTASPNAGWTMSAAAGALGITLQKEGHYRLGPELSSPSAADISRAVGLVKTAYILFVIVVLLITIGIRYGSGA